MPPPTFALAMTVQRASPSADNPYLPTNPAIWSEGNSSLPNSSLGQSTTSTGYFARSAAMARYDLSVSPHSLATFTKSTGFPAKLEKSTRRPDRAVAWNWCSCIDAGAVVLSLIIKRECPASAALPKCAYRAFALLGGTNTQEWATNTADIFPKNCQTTPCASTYFRARARLLTA